MTMATALQRREDGHQLQLINVVVSTVKPAEKTAHAEKYDPSVFDLYSPDLYMPILLLFKPDRSRDDQNTLSASEFVARIKRSLSRILVPYYTLAGRFRKTYDMRIRELLCNDEGVPFIEAEIDQDMENVVNLDDFQPLSILSGYEFVGLDPLAFCQEQDFLLPAAFIQTTKFRCGGISVNFTFFHMVGDGKAIFQFLKDWSQMTLDEQISFEPIHDRSLTYPFSALLDIMAAGSDPSIESEPENLENVVLQENSQIGKFDSEALPIQDRAHDLLDELNTSVQKEGSSRSYPSLPVTTTSTGSTECNVEYSKNRIDGNVSASNSKPVDTAAQFKFPLLSEWTQKTLHVRRECVQKLKEVAKNRNDAFVPTAQDCIQAQLWRAMSRIPSSIDEREYAIYGFPVEGRQRLHETPIPDSYSGNCFLLIYTPPIQQPSDDPLVEAGIINQLVRSVTPQSWRSHFANAMAVMTRNDSKILVGTSWYRFPLYEVDFGFGKPILTTYNNTNSLPFGLVVIRPPRPGSDFLATVQLCMDPIILQVLLNDSEFRSFFH